MIALVLALAATLGPPVVAWPERHASWRGRHPSWRERRCEPYAERCVRNTIYTCTAAGHWRRGLDCARAGRRDRVTVCSQEPDGSAICVEDGGAR